MKHSSSPEKNFSFDPAKVIREVCSGVMGFFSDWNKLDQAKQNTSPKLSRRNFLSLTKWGVAGLFFAPLISCANTNDIKENSDPTPEINELNNIDNPTPIVKGTSIPSQTESLDDIPENDRVKYFDQKTLEYSYNICFNPSNDPRIPGNENEMASAIRLFNQSPILQKRIYQYLIKNNEERPDLANYYLVGMLIGFLQLKLIDNKGDATAKRPNFDLDRLGQKWLELATNNFEYNFNDPEGDTIDMSASNFSIVTGLMQRVLFDNTFDPHDASIEQFQDLFKYIDPSDGLGVLSTIPKLYLLKHSVTIKEFLTKSGIDINAPLEILLSNELVINLLIPLLNYAPLLMKTTFEGNTLLTEEISSQDIGGLQTLLFYKLYYEIHHRVDLDIDLLKIPFGEALATIRRRFDAVGELRESLITRDRAHQWNAIHSIPASENIDFEGEKTETSQLFLQEVTRIRSITDVPTRIKEAIKLLGIETKDDSNNRYLPEDGSSRCNIAGPDLFRLVGVQAVSHLVDPSTNEPIFDSHTAKELFAYETGINIESRIPNTESYSFDEIIRALKEQDAEPLNARNFVNISYLSYTERIDLLKRGYIFYGASDTHNWVVWGDNVKGEFLPILTQATVNLSAQYLAPSSYKIRRKSIVSQNTYTRLFAIKPV